jgi:hypothetical protein
MNVNAEIEAAVISAKEIPGNSGRHNRCWKRWG